VSNRRYNYQVGGEIDGRTGKYQHAGEGARQSESNGEGVLDGECGRGAGIFANDVIQQADSKPNGSGPGNSERGRRTGGAGSDDVRCADGEGRFASGSDRERDLHRPGVSGGEQAGGASAELGAVSSSPSGLVLELSGLLAEATAALSVLDAAALERIGERAAILDSQRGKAEQSAGGGVVELQARFRVFAQILTATGENLKALARSSHPEDYDIAIERLVRSVPTEIMAYETEVLPCTWPRGRVAQARALRERAERG